MPPSVARGPDGCLRPAALALLLGALALLTTFLGLEPLLLFGAWGSDSGEYALLSQSLLAHQRFWLQGYHGWGFGYPYFPGMFEVGAAVASATGADTLLSLELTVPILGALGVVPLFLLFRRLFPSDRVALLGAALSGVASTRLLVLSHAAPLTLGDLLWVASLWALVEQRRDARWWAVLSLTAPSLVLTHHLSSYFFLVSAVGLVVGVELFAPRRWSRRFPLRELAFLGAFSVALFVYWFDYAPPFAREISQGLLGSSPLLAPLGGILGVVVAGALIELRRRRALGGRGRWPAWSVRWPNRTHVVRDVLVLGGLIFGGLSLLFLVPLPGTGDKVTLLDLLWFTPTVLYVPLASGAKGVLPIPRLGPAGYTIMIAIGLSAIFALATGNIAIPADRHPEYLFVPLALVVAVVVGRALASARASPRRGAYAAALGAVVVLMAANAATAYPPPSVLVGFQEGFTAQDLTLASWMATELSRGAHLASDHRLSDLYFFDSGGSPATWDNASCLFVGDRNLCAMAELKSSYLPNPPLRGPVDVVAADATMVQSGVALDPSEPAVPMSPSALARLAGPGFVVLYSDGDQTVWWASSTAPG
ncbi:MAG: hypothetical protein KGJ23_02255 [Euryarchaeota archaeon]|nr:hypothetical protein [Euryarchaeota archaeon]MDE1835418.1 hypothetical protein [Euryarchaeota archaeon]MDE1879554.1 hypothetical protein [Euryarchaeota archaeon]MDE2046069.1 hypothetical protein [Thermoplasmata archaeon]